jgi:hypothetical protein
MQQNHGKPFAAFEDGCRDARELERVLAYGQSCEEALPGRIRVDLSMEHELVLSRRA